jgi:hypothetical protein
MLDRQGNITRLPADMAPKPAPLVGQDVLDDPKWAMTGQLWNWQCGFEQRLHEERRIAYPWDFDSSDPRYAASLREWIINTALAFHEERRELWDARRERNEAEEVVDTLHFTIAAAIRLGFTVRDLGCFEDVFEGASEMALRDDVLTWQDARLRYADEYHAAIVDFTASVHKHWKKHPALPNLEACLDGLRRVQRCNFAIASTIFPSAQAMFDQYASKVQVNHARQDGAVASRADYKAVTA